MCGIAGYFGKKNLKLRNTKYLSTMKEGARF